MNFYRNLLRHHVLANLLFSLVLIIGFLSYLFLPRQQDPTINFNWIVITTILPGASALDIEKRVTEPIEDAVRDIQHIRFISSNSRTNISSMLIRFEDIDEKTFDKQLIELRREIQNITDELPDETENPLIWEVTSGNAYPTATITISGEADDENLRQQSQHIRKDLERMSGVHRVDAIGLNDPEIKILIDPDALEQYRISVNQLIHTMQSFFQDSALGQINLKQQNWMIRLLGTESSADKISRWPVLGSEKEVSIDQLATVIRSGSKAEEMVLQDGKAAVLLAIMKQDNANNIVLIDKVKSYIEQRNILLPHTGVRLTLIDDQTIMTQSAIQLMQRNALIGLAFVLIVAYLFLGARIAILTAIGIPFILAGTFWILFAIGETLNVTVLLGVVIVLGMLVDDAVVIVEAIYYRISHGQEALEAAISSLQEVAIPVTIAVLTTIAAFMPLMLLPGILGDFMRVIPMVVTIALLLSLVEAFWMLPTHIVTANIHFNKPSRIQRLRQALTHKIQLIYLKSLSRAIRHPLITFMLIILLITGSVFALLSGQIKMNFFAADTLRIFYVNIEMPSDSSLQQTLDTAAKIEAKVKQQLVDGEVRQVVTYAGLMFTETEPLNGDKYAQILLGLHPETENMRTVDEMIDSMRDPVKEVIGPLNVSFLKISGGPPVTKPVSIKVRGDNYQKIEQAVSSLKSIMSSHEAFIDISDDATRGSMELSLQLNKPEIQRLGLDPGEIQNTLRVLIDGQIINNIRINGEKVNIRLQADPNHYHNLSDLLNIRLLLSNGQFISLSNLVIEERKQSLSNIRHYNFRRAITLESGLKKESMNTIEANLFIQDEWKKLQSQFPDIDLDFTGELDDIQDSLDSIGILFVFGVGLMYLLLGTQFKSYWQPLMILSTVIMAFTGVVIGLLITGNPLSLYTLYGIVALAGIAVNAAIVLISAANSRLTNGMGLVHATIYSARRRVIPILITSMTTIAGLFSLATGLGGHSLIWAPVATAIVWGLFFSTFLTLFLIPLLYCSFMRRHAEKMRS